MPNIKLNYGKSESYEYFFLKFSKSLSYLPEVEVPEELYERYDKAESEFIDALEALKKYLPEDENA